MDILSRISKCLQEGEEELAGNLVREAIAAGLAPQKILLDRFLALIEDREINLIIEGTNGLFCQPSQFEDGTPAKVSMDFYDPTSVS